MKNRSDRLEKIVVESGENEAEAVAAFWVEQSPEIAFNISATGFGRLSGSASFRLLPELRFYLRDIPTSLSGSKKRTRVSTTTATYGATRFGEVAGMRMDTSTDDR